MKKTKNLVFIALSAAFIAICAWLTIPGPVPFTMQTMAVVTVAALLGPWQGAAAVLVYLLLGAVGVPVFSGFRGGVQALVGPTGGYLVGFLFTALLTGWIARRSDKLLPLVLAMAAGIAVCYVFGTAWFGLFFAKRSTTECQRMVGDVEVHLKPADWTAHQHCTDAAYNKVMSHVTWYRGDPPLDLPRGCISICLGDFFRSRSDFSPDEIDVAAYPYAKLPKTERPCERYFGRHPESGLATLLAAGRRRLEIKARRLQTRIIRTGNPEQVFYEELFTAFGYAKNSEPFRVLAERMPLAMLPNTEAMAYEALNSVAELEVAKHHPWSLANVRPNNAPSIRIADAAAIFTGGKPHHIGVHLSAAILANVIVPFALARGALGEPPK